MVGSVSSRVFVARIGRRSPISIPAVHNGQCLGFQGLEDSAHQAHRISLPKGRTVNSKANGEADGSRATHCQGDGIPAGRARRIRSSIGDGQRIRLQGLEDSPDYLGILVRCPRDGVVYEDFDSIVGSDDAPPYSLEYVLICWGALPRRNWFRDRSAFSLAHEFHSLTLTAIAISDAAFSR